MQSVQESKQELEASIRYAENAISSAKATIESMEFRQEMAKKTYQEQTGREFALAEREEALERDLTAKTAQANAWKKEYEKFKAEADDLRDIIDRMSDDATSDSVTIKQLRDEIATLKEERAMLDKNVKYFRDEIATLKDQLAEREDKWDQAMLEKAKLNDRLMISTKEVGQLQSEVDELSKAYDDSYREEIIMKKAWREQRELVALRDDQIAMLERRLAKYTGEKTYPLKEGDLYYVLNQLDGTWIESVWDDESESLHDSTSVPDHPHKVYFTVDQKNVLDKFKPKDD